MKVMKYQDIHSAQQSCCHQFAHLCINTYIPTPEELPYVWHRWVHPGIVPLRETDKIQGTPRDSKAPRPSPWSPTFHQHKSARATGCWWGLGKAAGGTTRTGRSSHPEVCQDPDTTDAGCNYQDLDLQKAGGNKKAIAGELADCPEILVVCITSLQRNE